MHHPLTHTVASRNTPSNVSQMRLPSSCLDNSNVRRYQAMLFVGYFTPSVLKPWLPSAAQSNGSSTAQSCGRLTVRQKESENFSDAGPEPVPEFSRCSASGQSSPRWNFHPASSERCSRGESAKASCATTNAAEAMPERKRNGPLIFFLN